MTDKDLINKIDCELERVREGTPPQFTAVELIYIKHAIESNGNVMPMKCMLKYGRTLKHGEYCLCRRCWSNGIESFVSYNGDRSKYCRTCGGKVVWDE